MGNIPNFFLNMDKIKLEIAGLSYSQTQSGAYALVLSESIGKRRLPIIIGGFEAQAIAIELEKMTPSRPLTHDLFKNFAELFKINISERVCQQLDGLFNSAIQKDQSEHNIVNSNYVVYLFDKHAQIYLL